MRRILRRIRGGLGTAVLWGASWFVAMFGVLTVTHLFGWMTGPEPWLFSFLVSLNVGVTGFLTGSVFSGYLSVVYRDRQLLELDANRIGAAGAGVAATFSVVLALTRATFGFPFVLGDVVAAAFWVGVFGSITASTSIRLAQSAARELTSGAADELSAEQEAAMALLADDGGPGSETP